MKRSLLSLFLGFFLSSILFAQTTVDISAEKDNSIYSESNNLSLGAGDWVFLGRTNQGNDRRALLKFDVAANVPAGAMITDVTLELNVDEGKGGQRNADVHVLTQDWGEGSANNPGSPGQGGFPSTDDCSWAYTFWSISMWTNPGGDFDANSIASTNINDSGIASWNSTDLTSTVQDWLDGTTPNHGIILIGDESTNQTAKKLHSRENATGQPVLKVTYTTSTGLSSNVSSPKFSIHPNPVQSNFSLHGSTADIESLEIIDLKGSKLKRLDPNVRDFSIADLERGIYLLKIQGDGFSVTQKLIKR